MLATLHSRQNHITEVLKFGFDSALVFLVKSSQELLPGIQETVTGTMQSQVRALARVVRVYRLASATCVAWDERSRPSLSLSSSHRSDSFAVLGAMRSSRNPHHWRHVVFVQFGGRHER